MITFIKSPAGQFGLAYFEGQSAELSKALESELVDSGYATYTKETIESKELDIVVEDATSKAEVETGKKKVSKK